MYKGKTQFLEIPVQLAGEELLGQSNQEQMQRVDSLLQALLVRYPDHVIDEGGYEVEEKEAFLVVRLSSLSAYLDRCLIHGPVVWETVPKGQTSWLYVSLTPEAKCDSSQFITRVASGALSNLADHLLLARCIHDEYGYRIDTTDTAQRIGVASLQEHAADRLQHRVFDGRFYSPGGEWGLVSTGAENVSYGVEGGISFMTIKNEVSLAFAWKVPKNWPGPTDLCYRISGKGVIRIEIFADGASILSAPAATFDIKGWEDREVPKEVLKGVSRGAYLNFIFTFTKADASMSFFSIEAI